MYLSTSFPSKKEELFPLKKNKAVFFLSKAKPAKKSGSPQESARQNLLFNINPNPFSVHFLALELEPGEGPGHSRLGHVVLPLTLLLPQALLGPL